MSVVANVLRKILFFPLTRMFIAIFAVVSVVLLESLLAQRIGGSFGFLSRTAFRALSGAVIIVSTCLVYAGYVRIFERRKTVELSRDRAVREFAAGSALGFGLIAATIGCLGLGGFYLISGVGLLPSLGFLFAAGLVPAFMEEIIIRGIVFRITEESLGTWLAIVISGGLFGALHIMNPEATWYSALCIAVEAGVLLAAAYVTTRRLWLPIGVHFAWNFAQGGIFGVPVSGIAVRGLLKSTLKGPELLSGGEFGAEASIFAVIICTGAAIVLLYRAVQNGQIVRPFWSRKQDVQTKPLEDGEV